eukprot:TRINITY_DN2944_c0_g1_i1.p1 TRINITY_DN2944_c0_g1~~TRINITY_DN2944_c0_g1_i1.p1  ORF type:complete len:274 (-),score=54.10 TRINITY_DN2944_c0_g1_i1:74-793(-)
MISKGLVVNGCRVYISSRRREDCDKTAAELNKISPHSCFVIEADLSKETECRKVADYMAQQEPNGVHILVNNAGCNWGAPLAEYPESAWDKVMNLNVKTVFLLSKYMLPSLRAAAQKEDPARIVNIGSIDGFRVPALETYAYSTSKAALHHLTHVLANKLSEDNVTVNAIAAGPFRSKMMAYVLDKFQKHLEADIPMGRIGEPEDIVGLTIFLCSRAGNYVTGAIIPLEGGILIKNARY